MERPVFRGSVDAEERNGVIEDQVGKSRISAFLQAGSQMSFNKQHGRWHLTQYEFRKTKDGIWEGSYPDVEVRHGKYPMRCIATNVTDDFFKLPATYADQNVAH